MAWYEMEYKCGHAERVQLYGKITERERRLEWAKNNKDCPECYKERMAKERIAQNERAATLSSEIGFVTLTGSEKQIAWATTIRQQVYEKLCIDNNPKTLPKLLSLETSSQWWIENRTNDVKTILKKIAACYPTKWETIQNENA